MIAIITVDSEAQNSLGCLFQCWNKSAIFWKLLSIITSINIIVIIIIISSSSSTIINDNNH